MPLARSGAAVAECAWHEVARIPHCFCAFAETVSIRAPRPPISRTAVNLLLSALQRISLWQQVLALLASLPARRLAADKFLGGVTEQFSVLKSSLPGWLRIVEALAA